MGRRVDRKSKSQRILMHLLKGKTLNQAQAAKLFGAWRLSAVIHNLRKKGFEIEMNHNTRGTYKGFGRYQITKTPDVKRIGK